MITEPAVFILGAGASAPFGFPTGQLLVKNICKNIGTNEQQGLLNWLGYTKNDINDFRNALFYSGKTSIDAFLEHRIEFLDIGKLAIAINLIPFENTDKLFTTPDWYQYLYSNLIDTLQDFGKSQLSILTFNYDRSLEHYLFTAISNSYGLSEEESAHVINAIPIIHMHGRLGYLPWQQLKLARPYSPSLDSPVKQNLKEISSLIKIIHEDIDTDFEFNQAHELLSKAKHIHFLGFGYNSTNMKRLNISTYLQRNTSVISGTSVGLSQREMESLRKIYPNIELTKTYVDSFLREFASAM